MPIYYNILDSVTGIPQYAELEPNIIAYYSNPAAITVPTTTDTAIQFQTAVFTPDGGACEIVPTPTFGIKPLRAGFYAVHVFGFDFRDDYTAQVRLKVTAGAGGGLVDIADMPFVMQGSTIVYCNGSTDVIRAFIWHNNGGNVPLFGLVYDSGGYIAVSEVGNNASASF